MLNQQREQMHARLMPQATYGVELSQPLGEVVEQSDEQIANVIIELSKNDNLTRLKWLCIEN